MCPIGQRGSRYFSPFFEISRGKHCFLKLAQISVLPSSRRNSAFFDLAHIFQHSIPDLTHIYHNKICDCSLNLFLSVLPLYPRNDLLQISELIKKKKIIIGHLIYIFSETFPKKFNFDRILNLQFYHLNLSN